MTSQDCTRDRAADSAAMGDFVVELFCRVGDAMAGVPKHAQAKLWPSELVTLGLLFALKGRGSRAFARWAQGNLRGFFPWAPERTRLFRLLAAHRDWVERFLAEPTLLGQSLAWAWPTPTASSCSTRAARGAARPRSAGRASRTGAGSSGPSWPWPSTASGWSSAGTRTRPTSPTGRSSR